MMLIIIAACRSDFYIHGTQSTSTAFPIVSVNELRFKDTETGQLFYTLDRCIKNITNDTWNKTSYFVVGNFYKSRWCKGTGARKDCQFTKATSNNRDQHVFELYTLFYPQSYPEVFGLGFHTHKVPESTGWGVHFSFDENGSSVVGSGWKGIFNEYLSPTGSPKATVYLGSVYSYTIFGDDPPIQFRIFSDLPLKEDLAIYLSGSENMRDRALSQNQALKKEVITAINAHQINTCDMGPYLGDGIPPQCTQRALTPKEEMEERVKADAYFAEQEKLLRLYHEELYNAWMMTFPFDECWP